MKDKDNNLKDRLSAILPDRQYSSSVNGMSKEEVAQKGAQTIKTRQKAKELAKLKYKEHTIQHAIAKEQQVRQDLAESLNIPLDQIPNGMSPEKAKAFEESKKREEAITAIEAQISDSAPGANALDVQQLAEVTPAAKYPEMVNKALQLQGASRPEIAKLLTSLNINLSVRLSKTDTANLLACLLTCNETQLNALLANKKLPVAIKAVIKRIQEDAKLGNIEVIERLWTRLFGKEPLTQNDLPQNTISQGIIPNTPISREAYVIIRDTLLK